jgi:lysophospholipase L1-like esterase
MLGDSLTGGDGSAFGEYPNWVTQLAANGQFTVPSGANAAVGGAVVANLSGQFSSAPFQAVLPSLNDVVVIMGGNDAVSLIAGGESTSTYIATVVSDIEGGLSSIHTSAPGVHRIMATVPDVMVTLSIQAYVAAHGISAATVATDEAAIQSANSQLIAFGIANHIPILDLYASSATVAPPAPSSPVSFLGHQPLTLAGYSFYNDHYTNPSNVTFNTSGLFSLADQFHPGPVIHGLIANQGITAANYFGSGLTLMSDQQLVQNALGGSLPASGPTFFNVTPYVIPEPSSRALALGGLAIV